MTAAGATAAQTQSGTGPRPRTLRDLPSIETFVSVLKPL